MLLRDFCDNLLKNVWRECPLVCWFFGLIGGAIIIVIFLALFAAIGFVTCLIFSGCGLDNDLNIIWLPWMFIGIATIIVIAISVVAARKLFLVCKSTCTETFKDYNRTHSKVPQPPTTSTPPSQNTTFNQQKDDLEINNQNIDNTINNNNNNNNNTVADLSGQHPFAIADATEISLTPSAPLHSVTSSTELTPTNDSLTFFEISPA
jgi:hypothetical protein